MKTLDDIKAPVASDLKGFEQFFRSRLESPDRLLTLATNYVFRRKGKQMRPLLVFLSASAAGGVSTSTPVAATLIELLHNASLVHDDVVDETYERRGQLSLMGFIGSKVAVLVGDFFLSRGLQVAIAEGQYAMLGVISDAVGELSRGELSQLDHARHLDITEEAYYGVIRQKTAVLIEACTRCGALSAGASEEVVRSLSDYGMALGMAFQIRDDLFDYTPGGAFGKPTLNDIKEQKMTLPLIAALRNAPADECAGLMRAVRRDPSGDETAAMALRLVRNYGGMEYATAQMESYAARAKEALSVLPDTQAKESLIALVDYNSSRKS